MEGERDEETKHLVLCVVLFALVCMCSAHMGTTISECASDFSSD